MEPKVPIVTPKVKAMYMAKAVSKEDPGHHIQCGKKLDLALSNEDKALKE
jgi:hypothetical protein